MSKRPPGRPKEAKRVRLEAHVRPQTKRTIKKKAQAAGSMGKVLDDYFFEE